MLELLDELHQVVTGLPGAQRARQRGAESHPQPDDAGKDRVAGSPPSEWAHGL